MKKISLVLGSGSAKGYAHVGVLKALEENHIHIKEIIGTSMGALIGALYALHPDVKKLEKNILKYQLKDLVSFHDLTFNSGLIKAEKIEELLKKEIGKKTFEDCKIKLIINAVDLVEGKEVIFKKGSLLKAIRASISIPLLFTPEITDHEVLVDGGLISPLATHIFKDEKVVVVNLNRYVPHFEKKNLNILKIFIQVVDILERELSKEIKKTKNSVWIEPNFDGLGLFDFNKQKQFIKIGYDDTIKKMVAIKRLIK